MHSWPRLIAIPPLPQALDSVRRTPAGNLDSLSRSLRRDTTIAVSNAKALADSAKLDTTRQRSGLEVPVDYTAKDSLVYDATTGLLIFMVKPR